MMYTKPEDIPPPEFKCDGVDVKVDYEYNEGPCGNSKRYGWCGAEAGDL